MFASLNSPFNSRRGVISDERFAKAASASSASRDTCLFPTFDRNSGPGIPAAVTSSPWLKGFSTEGFEDDSGDADCGAGQTDPVSAAAVDYQHDDDDDVDGDGIVDICLALANPAIDNDAWNATWFREGCNGSDVEALLQGKPNGYFIVHNNLSEKALGFSYAYDNMVRHTAIELQNSTINLFGDRDRTFITLSDLVHHYSHNWTEDCRYTLPCKLAADMDTLTARGDAEGEDDTAAAAAAASTPFVTIDDSSASSSLSVPKTTSGGVLSRLKKMRVGEGKGLPSMLKKSKSDNTGRKKAKNKEGKRSRMTVSWDEGSIVAAQRALELHRGIYSCVDAAAAEAPYFMGDILNVEAAEILNQAEVGAFIMYTHEETDCLNLAYVGTDGKIVNTFVLHTNGKGIALQGTSTTFRSLSQLVACFSGANAELPNLLRLPRPGDLMGEPWMHPAMTRQSAATAVQPGQTGTFVVRSSRKGDCLHVITYVHEGVVYHAPVEDLAGLLRVRGATRTFDTLSDLVSYYSRPEAEGDGEEMDLRARLRVPDDPLLGGGLNKRPQWLRLGVPKDKVLRLLDLDVPGSFVVRSSESKLENLVLSYVHRTTVQHEHILTRRTKENMIKYALQKMADVNFGSLDALVTHHMVIGRGLRCPLYKSDLSATARGALAASRRKVPSIESMDTPAAAALVPDALAGYAKILQHPRIDQGARESPWLCMHLTKEQALAGLSKDADGCFVVRRNAQHFATLSLIVNGKIYNAHIVESEGGLKLKSSGLTHLTLSAFVHHYRNESQADLPRHLVSL